MKTSGTVIGNVGDVNFPEYEGGIVLRNDDGSCDLEYVLTPCDDVDDEDSGARWTVYRASLDNPNVEGNEWCDWKVVARTSGISWKVYRKAFHPSRTLTDDVALERAYAIVDAAGYYGWENFDSYPLELTKDEVEARYSEDEPSPEAYAAND